MSNSKPKHSHVNLAASTIANSKIAIIVARFNANITDKLLEGAYSTLVKSGLSEKQINVLKVPGAVEIPLVAKLLAQSKKYHAIICLGAVIRGDTDHYKYVCEQVSQGCQKIMLDFDLPVIFGVLTTENLKQAQVRVSYKSKVGHKGVEAAHAALEMIQLLPNIQ